MPVLSQECEEGPRIRERPTGIEIEYDFRTKDRSEHRWEAIMFVGVAAFSFTGFEHCSEEHAAAFDRLLEVGDSSWLSSLGRVPEGTKHFRIFFDDFGCYDVAAKSFTPPLTEGEGH